MKLISQKSLDNNGLFKLKDNNWLAKQRIAGKVAADALTLLENLVKEKTTKSLIELDKIAKEYIIANDCQPTFLGYHGFPNSCCISVNQILVHGVCTDYILKDGDIVSFDLGATYENVIADTAITCIYGDPIKPEHLKMVKACEEALMKGIAACKVGNKIGAIGNAIYKSAKGNGFNVVTKYGGHGIDFNPDGTGMPHAPPFISNKANIDEGFRMQKGFVCAIEPLLVLGSSTETKTLADGWSITTDSLNCHFEHSIYLHDDHVEILTQRN